MHIGVNLFICTITQEWKRKTIAFWATPFAPECPFPTHSCSFIYGLSCATFNVFVHRLSPVSTRVATSIGWRRPRVTLRALRSCLARDMPWLVLSFRTNLSARMPSPAFTLASEALLARTAASHLVTACSPRNKPRRPRWPPRSDGLSPLPTTDWTLPPRHTTPPRLLISPVTRPPFCHTQLLEWKRCPCPGRDAPTDLWGITASRRAGERAPHRNIAASPALSCRAGRPTPWGRERPPPVTWYLAWRMETPSRQKGRRLAGRTKPNRRTCLNPAG